MYIYIFSYDIESFEARFCHSEGTKEPVVRSAYSWPSGEHLRGASQITFRHFDLHGE